MGINIKRRTVSAARPSGEKYLALCLVLVISAFVPSVARSQMTAADIYTAAGTGTAGYSGDGGLATAAKIAGPSGLVVDSSGNVYFADTLNARIRRIDASTGEITTIAGNGTVGYSGDGGAATSARLNAPTSLAIDSSGNLYIGDCDNYVVRKVTASSGIITTIAGKGTGGFSGDGGPATSANLSVDLLGLAVDAAGNVFISDSGNQRIRKVTVSTGYISTIAGNGVTGFTGDGSAATSAELDQPWGLALDSSGNLYIADCLNQRVRIVYASTGDINTIAGDGAESNTGDGGPATGAALELPVSLAFDASGSLYIGVYAEVREMNKSSSAISTVAGNGTYGYSGDGGLATSGELNEGNGLGFNPAGSLYISDTSNNRIREVYKLSPPPPPPSPKGTWIASTVTCYGGSFGASVANQNGPLMPFSGLANLVSVNDGKKTAEEDCTWSGFPSIVTTTATTISFYASLSKNGTDATFANFEVYGLGSESVPVSAPYSGTYTLSVPIGTNISTISVYAVARAYANVNDIAQADIGYIYIYDYQ